MTTTSEMTLSTSLDDAKAFLHLCTIPSSPTQMVVVTLTHLILLTLKTDGVLFSTLHIRDVERDQKSTFKQVLFTPSNGTFNRGLCVVLTSHGHLYCFDLQGSFGHPKYVLIASNRSLKCNAMTACDEYLIVADREDKLHVMDQMFNIQSTKKFDDQILHLDGHYTADKNSILYATESVVGRLRLSHGKLKRVRELAEDLHYEHIELSAEADMFTTDNLLRGLRELPSEIRGIVVFDDTRTILFTLDGSQYDVRTCRTSIQV